MHKRIALKRVLKFTSKEIQHVSVQSPSSGRALYELVKVTMLKQSINPLNPELNPICYLLALLAHHFLHVSRIRVKSLTLR